LIAIRLAVRKFPGLLAVAVDGAKTKPHTL
jgi:hypothetical protein